MAHEIPRLSMERMVAEYGSMSAGPRQKLVEVHNPVKKHDGFHKSRSFEDIAQKLLMVCKASGVNFPRALPLSTNQIKNMSPLITDAQAHLLVRIGNRGPLDGRRTVTDYFRMLAGNRNYLRVIAIADGAYRVDLDGRQTEHQVADVSRLTAALILTGMNSAEKAMVRMAAAEIKGKTVKEPEDGVEDQETESKG